MTQKSIRAAMRHLALTPLHPQWVINRINKRRFLSVSGWCEGLVVDIGCSDRALETLLPKDRRYVGLDYPSTAVHMYRTRPTVYGDAQCLPLRDECADTAVLLEVLEHIPEPQAVFSEISRVLKANGRLIASVPFLYPLHDSPFDFQRLTVHGLEHLAKKNGLRIREKMPTGTPLATAALLTNIALCRAIMKGLDNKSPFLLLGALVPPVVVVLNLIAWVSEKLVRPDDFMPIGFTMILEKVD